MLLESGEFKRPMGWVKRDIPFAYGYEGRGLEFALGLKPGRKRKDKTSKRKFRSHFKGEIPYVLRPRARPEGETTKRRY